MLYRDIWSLKTIKIGLYGIHVYFLWYCITRARLAKVDVSGWEPSRNKSEDINRIVSCIEWPLAVYHWELLDYSSWQYMTPPANILSIFECRRKETFVANLHLPTIIYSLSYLLINHFHITEPDIRKVGVIWIHLAAPFCSHNASLHEFCSPSNIFLKSQCLNSLFPLLDLQM